MSFFSVSPAVSSSFGTSLILAVGALVFGGVVVYLNERWKKDQGGPTPGLRAQRFVLRSLLTWRGMVSLVSVIVGDMVSHAVFAPTVALLVTAAVGAIAMIGFAWHTLYESRQSDYDF